MRSRSAGESVDLGGRRIIKKKSLLWFRGYRKTAVASSPARWWK
jgi:hypothetical protein